MDPLIAVLVSVGLALYVLIGLTFVVDGINRVFTRVCLAFLRDTVEQSGRAREERRRLLQSIHATATFPVYAAKTIAYAAITAMATSLLGTAVVVSVIQVLLTAHDRLLAAVPGPLQFMVPARFGLFGFWQVFGLFLICSVTFGLFGAIAAYSGRWWYVRLRSDQRRILIDESVARTIAFIYALSRSGMVYPQIVRTVGRNRRAFGESAEEIGVVVKDMDLFGADLVTALERIARRSPSDQFADFAENFANVLQSGQNVSRYLHEQYDQYQRERIANQERLLEMFTALGEAYVAGLVAGPLFLITILLIFGILIGGLLGILRAAVYLLIPAANLVFIGYLDSIGEPLSSYRAAINESSGRRPLQVRRAGEGLTRTDGGRTTLDEEHALNRIRLAAYIRLNRFRRGLVSPVETVIAQPSILLVLLIPLATAIVIGRLWLLSQGGVLSIRTADGVVVEAILLVVAPFAVVNEIRRQRIRGIEAAVPDFLERLANTNEAGMTFTESLRRIERNNLGALNAEVERLIADVNWGARTETALLRFNDRIGSATVARVVALLTNAMAASGNLAPVIRIAADEASEDRRLRRTRRQELFMYVVIIYLAFAIFLGIGIALRTILIPAIPTAAQLGGLASSSGGFGVNLPISPVQGADKSAYTLLLYHAAIVQAVCSGLVAGQMGEGSVANGAKHVTIMLAGAFVVFLVLG